MKRQNAKSKFVYASGFLLLLSLNFLFAQTSQDKESAGQDETVYAPGNGVTLPRVIYGPDPDYTDHARKAKINGTVILSLVVTSQGKADKVMVKKGLEPGLDKNAVEAVRTWKFEPGTRDGKPVAVSTNIEVTYRSY